MHSFLQLFVIPPGFFIVQNIGKSQIDCTVFLNVTLNPCVTNEKGGKKEQKRYKKEGKEEDSSGPDFQENLGKTHYTTGFSILQINTLYLTDFFSSHSAACNHASTVVK